MLIMHFGCEKILLIVLSFNIDTTSRQILIKIIIVFIKDN